MKNKILFILMFCMIFLVGIVSALTWDNIKFYDEETKTVTIKNAFGLGATLQTAKLNFNTYDCGRFCSAEKEITLYNDGILIEDLRFYRLFSDGSKELENPIRSSLKYLTDVPSYEWKCEIKYTPNLTEFKSCGYIENGTKKDWILFKEGKEFKAGTYQVKLEGEKRTTRIYDWQIKLQGRWINEWATWGNISAGDDAEVILNSPLDNSTSVTNVSFNATANVNGGANIVNMSLYLNTSGAWALNETIITIGGIGNRTQSPNISQTNTAGDTVKRGWTIFALSNVTLTKVTTYPGTVASDIEVYYLNQTLYATSSISSLNASFNIDLIEGQGYYVVTSGATTSAWAASPAFPYVLEFITIPSSFDFDGLLNQTNVVRDIEIITVEAAGAVTSATEIWNKTINGTTIWNVEACDSDGGCGFALANFTVNLRTIINVQSPTNITFVTSTIFFNATSNVPIDKWIVNYNGTNITLSDINTTLEVEDGNHQLLLYANSTANIFGLNDSIFFSVDTISPIINITHPTETISYHEINTNLSVNWTVTDLNLDTCILEYEGINTTVTCNDNSTNINITNSINRTIIFYANDTLGNSNAEIRSWNYKIFQNSLNYTLTTIGGNIELFTLNITKLSSLQISTVNLVYNGSGSSASFTSGDTSIITKSLNIPNPSADANLSFFFSFAMSDASIINTSSKNQTVLNFGIGNCSTFSTLIYNFTLLDEVNQTELDNVTIDYAFNLFDSTRTINIVNFSASSTVNPTAICINQNLTSTISFSLDAVLKYISSDADYLTRFYNILNFSLRNSTIPNNINLYDVLDTVATPFQITFRDASLVPAPNILVIVDKQFISSNDFKTVEIPITDTNGQAILNLVRDIGIYNLIFIDVGGNIVGSFSKISAFCQDFTIGQCTLDLESPAEISKVFNLSRSIGISYTLQYTNSTNTATLIFNSLNSTAVTMRMIGTSQNQFGNRSVCDVSLTSVLGTLDCNTSSILTTDNYIFIDISANGNYVATRIININPQNPLTGGLFGTNGYFIAFMLLLLIIILFSNDKQVLLVMLGFGWAMILILGLIKGAIIGSISGGIWLLVSIVTMIWKLKQEEFKR